MLSFKTHWQFFVSKGTKLLTHKLWSSLYTHNIVFEFKFILSAFTIGSSCCILVLSSPLCPRPLSPENVPDTNEPAKGVCLAPRGHPLTLVLLICFCIRLASQDHSKYVTQHSFEFKERNILIIALEGFYFSRSVSVDWRAIVYT